MSKNPISDLHIHTHYSPDSSATMQQYIDKALERNVEILCFTDHVECSDFLYHFDPKILTQRVTAFEKLKKEYDGQVKLLLGVEFGEPHLHMKELEFVKQLPLDMIIGSVHYALDVHYFASEGKPYDRRVCERMHNQYVLDMVQFGGFDVLGHLDMPKRYHLDYVEDVDAVQQILKICVNKGIVPEVNTSTLRRGISQTMPSLNMIEYYRSCGGRYVTVNSDSHTAGDLATNFEETVAQLPQGIECCYFDKHTLVPLKK